MKKIVILSWIFIATYLLGVGTSFAATQSQNPSKALLPSYGLYVPTGIGFEVTAPSTAAGKRMAMDGFKHVQTTQKIPNVLGVTFGFEYKLLGLPNIPSTLLQVKIEHPPMKSVSGELSVLTEADLSVEIENGVVSNYLVYRLSEEFERVPGKWVFSISYRGQLLLSQDFLVLPIEK